MKMKKILALLLILASFTLASCGDKRDDTKRIDQPSEEIALDLKLEDVNLDTLYTPVKVINLPPETRILEI